jgi:predicted dehydrogenase
MSRDTINVGIIGLGKIGKTHAEAYRQILEDMTDAPFAPQIKAVLRSRLGGDEEFIEKIGSPLVTMDTNEFFCQPLDIVDICTPNYLHLEQIEGAIAKRMNVYCEKPLGMNLTEANRIAALASDAGVLTHTAFVFRYFPAYQKAAALATRGGIGRPNHFRITNFHSSYLEPNKPSTWRLRMAESGGGALADLGVHMIDLIHHMLGEVAWVQCNTRTVINERPLEKDPSQRVKVDVDDWALCTMGLRNGASGTVEVSRVAGGKPFDSILEIYGSDGSVEASFEDCRTVRQFSQASGKWQSFDALGDDESIKLKAEWQKCKGVQDFFLTSHLASIYEFLGCVVDGKPSSMGFDFGLQAQEVLEAAYTSAAHDGVRIEIPSCQGMK